MFHASCGKKVQFCARFAIAVMFVTFGVARESRAALMHDTTPDSAYQALGDGYSSVGWFADSTILGTRTASGVLISAGDQSGYWLATAAHNILDANGYYSDTYYFGTGHNYFSDPGTVYGISKEDVFIVPGYDPSAALGATPDLALCRLEQSVLGVTPAERFYGTDSLDILLTQVGYGRPGTVSSGPGAYDGIVRGAQNISWNFGFAGIVSRDYWRIPFVYPGHFDYQPLGGLGTGGDSGGGEFATIGGIEYLVGIIDFGIGGYDYGSSTYSIRVSLYNEWIDTTISEHPAVATPVPPTILLFGSALLGLIGVRRRNSC